MVGISHAKVSAKEDGTDNTLVQPSDWNADHVGGFTDPMTADGDMLFRNPAGYNEISRQDGPFSMPGGGYAGSVVTGLTPGVTYRITCEVNSPHGVDNRVHAMLTNDTVMQNVDLGPNSDNSLWSSYDVSVTLGAGETKIGFYTPGGWDSTWRYLLVRQAASVVDRLPIGATGEVLKVVAGVPDWTTQTGQFTAIWDGGGSVLQTNKWVDIVAPYACTITGWTLFADVSGSATVDIWKDTYANFPPTVADSITASAKPTLTSAVKAASSTLTGWTTSVAAGDVLRFNLDSAASVTKLTLVVAYTRTA